MIKKEEDGYLTTTVSISGESKTDRTSKSVTLKRAKLLIEKIEGPFDETNQLVTEMEVDETYTFKATKSTSTQIEDILFAEQLDDGETIDLKHKKGQNPYLDENDVVCYRYKTKNPAKIRIYAYVTKPDETISILSEIVDEYVRDIRNGKLVYSCNSGWIDTSHAFEDTKRTNYNIGAINLWNQILNETGMKSNSPNGNGFKVSYRQDNAVPIIPIDPIGITKFYFVKDNLNVQQKEQVALAILQEVSLEFEHFQRWAAFIGKYSSFEPADLISNLMSFYRIVRPHLTKNVILNLSKALTPEQSVEVYRKYPGTFSDEKYKNREFIPKYFPNEHCSGQPVFPKELNLVKPASKNSIFRDWIPIIDVHAGKPPISGGK